MTFRPPGQALDGPAPAKRYSGMGFPRSGAGGVSTGAADAEHRGECGNTPGAAQPQTNPQTITKKKGISPNTENSHAKPGR
jgi:hypothetical protein